jgi:pyrroloquinoline quinone biosynthesis protein E
MERGIDRGRDRPEEVPAPFALIAEVTHSCPLHCVYCSNPLSLDRRRQELTTDEWARVFEEVAQLGVVQVHLTGGEPLDRTDILDLVGAAHSFGLYTNLITSGISGNVERGSLGAEFALELAERGLSSAQLSVQAATSGLSDRLAGYKSFERKLEAARAIRKADIPLTMNVVLTKFNIDQLEPIIDLCESWGADCLELANAQYYGWALVNRERLMPTRAQVAKAEEIYYRKKGLLNGKVELIWVIPDYYEIYPKPCMGGWGQLQMVITPGGTALPCSAAASIDTLRFVSVRDQTLKWIWYESPAFNKYRGFEWMPDPCRSCDRRFKDFGGCRCQAFALTGEAGQTDPVCQFAPSHPLIEEVTSKVNDETSRGQVADLGVEDTYGAEAFQNLKYRPQAKY